MDEEKSKFIKEKLSKDDDLKFDTLSYEQKLLLLFEYEMDLMKFDKAREENRRNIQTICRMSGSIAQSYFVYDQVDFSTARSIFYNFK